MLLSELLDRAYDILGDSRTSPRSFTAAEIAAYLNRGAVVFRQTVEDKWYRSYVPLVASQATYTFNDDHVRAQRIAYNDTTVPPATILALQSNDPKWETTPGPQPVAWTSDGLPFNQFRLYPMPNSSTSIGGAITFAVAPSGGGDTPDDGIVVDWLTGATHDSFALDPNDAGHTDLNTGTTVLLSGMTLIEDEGEIVFAESVDLSQLEIWGTVRPPEMNQDGDPVSIKPGYELAPLWYAIWHLYLEEGERHDSNLAGTYRGLWNELVSRAVERRTGQLPLQVHVLGDMPGAGVGTFPRLDSTMTYGGVQLAVRW